MQRTGLHAISHVANCILTTSENSRKIHTDDRISDQFTLKDLNQKIMLKVDTGSNINCISLGTFQRLFPHQPLTKSTLLLKKYGNSPVSIIGKFKAFICWKGKIFC